MMRNAAYGLTCVLMILVGAPALRATTIVLPTDEALVRKSPVIVQGLVLSSEVVDREGRIWTETTLAVSRNLKGATASSITVRELGGVLGDRIAKIYGTPQFTAGERVLLFLEESPRGGYRTMDLFVGKFSEGKTTEGQRLWLRSDTTTDAILLGADFQPLPTANLQRDSARFETFIEDVRAGRPGLKNYAVVEPQLEQSGGRWGVTSNFELIVPETLYRWTRFDSGQSAVWYSIGSQPGYQNNGVAQLQTAMAVWTGYSSANIRYVYSGVRTGTSTGLDSPNGFNEVLFNDPLNEVAGSYNPSTGGVVGIGGFNQISGAPSWTAPFTADAVHTAGVKSSRSISEGNLVIQDGVSAANGISANILAEILAHEFGHTLGFGHSVDGTALMFDTVTGLGPSLRADDQEAARWLYPKATTTPAGPTAPSSFAAAVSGDDVTLTWNDNANDETGFRLYRNGAIRTTVGANVRTFVDTNLPNGTYGYEVRAYSAGGESSGAVATAIVNALQKPQAQFDPPSGFINQPIAFRSSSTGTVTHTAWSFGDGTSGATGANVNHTYSRAGTFRVTLTVSNAAGESSIARDVQVIGNPAALFSWTPPFPTTKDTLTFQDESAGAPTAYTWDFGDGTTSTLQNPSKRFTTAGTKNVKLTVSRGNLTSTITKSVVVSAVVSGTPTVVAAFDASATTVTAGSDVRFTDRSTGAPTRWAWTFGDGTSSSAQNPTHIYAAPGVYTVTLISSNASNSATAFRTISVSAVKPFRTLLSAAAQTSGAGGTSWRTELNLFNAGSEGANVTLSFLPGSGGALLTKTIFLGARQSTTYANALEELFALENAGGALAIEASAGTTSADLRVSSRTFTPGAIGTYGQSVPDVQSGMLQKTLYVTGLASGPAFRTNVGLVNRSETVMNTTLMLYNATGSVIATKTVSAAPFQFQQTALPALFPELGTATHRVLTLRVTAPADAAISAYASVVDNATQDPIYIQAVPLPTGDSLLLPAIGRAPGANGTYWRSDVTFFNSSTTQMTLALRYRGTTKLLLVRAGDTEVLEDVLDGFGVTAGSGPLEVSWTSTVGPVVTSRTYTSVSGGGTYGQSIDPVAEFGRQLYVPGLRNDGTYRTNVGLLNGGSTSETFNVRLLSGAGTMRAEKTITLGPGELSQASIAALFPGVTLPASFVLDVEGDSDAKLFAYASIVDNQSNDPVFFAGR